MGALALEMNGSTPEELPLDGVKGTKKKTSMQYVRNTHTNELVIVLCAPIGSPTALVVDQLRDLLANRFKYDCKVIKLSDFIKSFAEKVGCVIKEDSSFNRVKTLITAGDELRKKYGTSILAELAIREVSVARIARKTDSESEQFEPARVCHIINSIKNQEELDLLRVVYREMLHCIGIGSPMSLRTENLKKSGSGMSPSEIYELIDQDSGEEFAHGQTVRDTYPNADFFLRADTTKTKNISDKLERYLNSILSTQIVTPTVEETAMFLAASAAANSACLSRQVGAAITDSEGNIVSLGWNDVPKAGGGLYCASNKMNTDDMRCVNINGGECQSDFWKSKTAGDIAEAIIKKKLVDRKMKDEVTRVISDSKIKDLLEFSKAVHAEMHAIITGSQKTGQRMIGGKLFCTTYPCHQCARHIVLSGIQEVYYIEPYRKSLAIMLHSDSITEDEADIKKIRILPFDGISPNRYFEVFKTKEKSRKTKGRAVVVSQHEAALKAKMTLESLPVLEAAVTKSLTENFEQ